MQMLKNFRKAPRGGAGGGAGAAGTAGGGGGIRPRRVTPSPQAADVAAVLPPVWVEVPTNYREAARWSPSIGEYFPNFAAESTAGKITFHPHVTGHWTIFFSIAAAFSETCTQELAQLSAVHEDLRREGVKIIGVARNSLAELHLWSEQIRKQTGRKVTIPLLADPDGVLTGTFGMIAPLAEENSAIRKTIIISPALKVSMIFEYPLFISRSIEETLRTLDAAREYHDERERARRAGY